MGAQMQRQKLTQMQTQMQTRTRTQTRTQTRTLARSQTQTEPALTGTQGPALTLRAPTLGLRTLR
jgi:hypothetical protein